MYDGPEAGTLAKTPDPPRRAAKFRDPDVTACGAPRARVALDSLETLWFNTGTLCNLACRTCYIESSPRNDRLAYIALAEVVSYLDEVDAGAARGQTRTIGLTGGEPFMNPDILPILETCLGRGYRVLVLTNAMRPMMRHAERLLAVRERFGDRLVMRVSLDHYDPRAHESERGEGSWKPALDGLAWLVDNGFSVHIAGRTCWGEDEAALRAGYGRLLARKGIAFDASDPVRLMLLPDLDETADVPEITEACWGILGVAPGSVMCATARMVVKRKGAAPSVVACTLLPYDERFDLGATLAEASRPVGLNHPHCARFCVLGGGACSR